MIGAGFVMPVSVDVLLSWLAPGFLRPGPAARDEKQGFCREVDDDFDANPESGGAPDPIPSVGLDESLSAHGLLHMWHNAGDSLLQSVPILAEAVDGATDFCKFWRTTSTRDRAIEALFSDPIGRAMTPKLKKFTAKVHKKRWGTLANATEKIISIICVRDKWSMERYIAHSSTAKRNNNDDEDEDGGGNRLSIVNDCTMDSAWWAKIITLDLLLGMIRIGMQWCESCSCHWDLLNDVDLKDIPHWLLQRWLDCPMRGMRLSEVSAGDLLCEFESLYRVTVVVLLQKLPRDIGDDTRAVCLAEFERGRGHIIFRVTLKISNYRVPPGLAFAIAHNDVGKSRGAVKVCLETRCDHAKMLELQSEPIRSEAIEYIEGVSLAELPHFKAFRAKLRWGFSAERKGEAGHATVNLRALRGRNRTEAFDSLALRLWRLKTNFKNDPTYVATFLESLDDGRSPEKLVESLNLGGHPAAQGPKHSWDRVYRQIVYHNDVETLYRRGCIPAEVRTAHEPMLPLDPPSSDGAAPGLAEWAPPPPACDELSLSGSREFDETLHAVQSAMADFCPSQYPKPAPLCSLPDDAPLSAMLAVPEYTWPAQYLDIKREAALKFMEFRVNENARINSACMYSAYVGDNAVSLLSKTMSVAAPCQGDALELWNAEEVSGGAGIAHDADFSGNIWFTVVDVGAPRAKRAYRGGIVRGTSALCSIHRLL